MAHILGPSKSLRTVGPPYFPAFSKNRNGYLRIRCRPSGMPTYAEAPKISTTPAFPADHFAQQLSLDTAISGAPQTIGRAPWTNNSALWTNNGTTQSISSALSIKRPFTTIDRVSTVSSGALICIGDETSKAMDRLKLPDGIILHLRALMCKTCSSRWEDVLREPQWGLNRKAANILAQAMRDDVAGKKVC